MRRLVFPLLFLGLACGCQVNPCRLPWVGSWGPPQRDWLYSRFLDEHHSRSNARNAARQHLKCLNKKSLSKDYERGFQQAFEDVAIGSRGGVPPQPPAAYWTECARSPVGHARIQEWYAGYEAGLELAMPQRRDSNFVPPGGGTCGTARVGYEQNCPGNP